MVGRLRFSSRSVMCEVIILLIFNLNIYYEDKFCDFLQKLTTFSFKHIWSRWLAWAILIEILKSSEFRLYLRLLSRRVVIKVILNKLKLYINYIHLKGHANDSTITTMSTPTTFPTAVLEVCNLLVLKYLVEAGFRKVSKKFQKLTQTTIQECSKLQSLNLKDVHKFVSRKSKRKENIIEQKATCPQADCPLSGKLVIFPARTTHSRPNTTRRILSWF